mmetsp:Transcript_18509/g.50548  ORF Transcript_18509/g.50548 Transcript_18509/m.50548 type:complete len:293 (+) Transcript_18509:3607-4485(+)
MAPSRAFHQANGDDDDGTSKTHAPLPIESYQLRRCPYNAWSFPGTLLSKTAKLASIANASQGVWTCGYTRGLRLEKNSSDFLESGALDRSYWSHFSTDSPALTVSVWFSVDAAVLTHDDPALYPILAWAVDPSEIHSHTGCHGYYLHVAIFRGHLLIQYSDQDPALSCKALYIRQAKLSDLVNSGESNMLVLTLGSGSTTISLNGRQLLPAAANSFKATPVDSWKKARLQVFGTSLSSSFFPGAIHEISLYNKALSEQSILQKYTEGILPNFTPKVPQSALFLRWLCPSLTT